MFTTVITTKDGKNYFTDNFNLDTDLQTVEFTGTDGKNYSFPLEDVKNMFTKLVS